MSKYLKENKETIRKFVLEFKNRRTGIVRAAEKFNCSIKTVYNILNS